MGTPNNPTINFAKKPFKVEVVNTRLFVQI